MYITFTLKNQIIKRTDKNIVVANSKNYLRAKFTFLTDDWGGTVTGIFNGFTAILDKNNECVVPWEALQFPGELTVSAFCGDRQTANKVYLPIMESGYIVRQTPEPPTPDVYQQLIDIAKNAESVANSVREDADAGKFDGKPGAPGKDAPQINDTQSSPDNPWSGAKVDKEIKAVYATLEKSNIQFPVAYSGSSIHANNTLAENLTLNRNSVEILGQTIQNCLDHSSVDKFTLLPGSISGDGYIQIQADGTYRNFAIRSTSAVLKPSTQYTLVIDVAENTLVGDGNAFQFFATGGHTTFFSTRVNANPQVGITKLVATTKDTFDGLTISFAGLIYSRITSGSVKFRLALIEGDWTDKDVSWVPFGLNTPQTTELHMVGKNLAKSFNAPLSTTRYGRALVVDAYFTPNTRYSLLIEGNSEDTFYTNEFLFIEDGNFRPGTVVQVTTKSYIDINSPNVFDPSRNKFIITKNAKDNSGDPFSAVYVYRGESITDKEPYTENTVTIDKPLGSVSETIRDRVYLKDGKAYYEQNVGQIVFDGSEEWSTPGVAPGSTVYTLPAFTAVSNIKRFGNGYSSLFAENLKGNFYSADTKGFNFEPDDSTSGCRIRVPVTELETIDISGIKKWLAEHPMVVVYQLDVPVTTEIPIADFLSYAGQTNWYTTNDIKPTLKAEIPSNIGAVVGALAIENAQLKKSNLSMYQEMDGRMAAMEGTIPIMAEAANNLAEADASYHKGVNSI